MKIKEITKLGRLLYYITIKSANFLAKHKWLYYILLFTWGGIMTYTGCIITIFLMMFGLEPTKYYLTWYFKLGNKWGGLELGLPFICDSRETQYIKMHELGHSVQNAIFGPFTIFISFIPSIIRYWYRELKYYRKGISPKTNYDDIWFELSATDSGMIIVDQLSKLNK